MKIDIDKLIVVLSDNQTWTGIDGCAIYGIDIIDEDTNAPDFDKKSKISFDMLALVKFALRHGFAGKL